MEALLCAFSTVLMFPSCTPHDFVTTQLAQLFVTSLCDFELSIAPLLVAGRHERWVCM